MTNIAAGKYRAKAKEWKWGKSSTGKEQLYIDFEFSSGPHAGQHQPAYLYFTEKTADRSLESLEYCGWDGVSLKELRGFGSKEVEIVIELETHEGNEYAKVKWINGLGGGVKEELDAGGLLALEQRMKGKLLARQQKRQQEKPRREMGDDTPDDDFGPTDYGDMPPV